MPKDEIDEIKPLHSDIISIDRRTSMMSVEESTEILDNFSLESLTISSGSFKVSNVSIIFITLKLIKV